MLKKLIASGSAAVIALTTLAQGIVMGAPAVTDPELIDAVSWAYDAGLTKYSDADAFMPFNNLTREQFSKFASQFASSVLNIEADATNTCAFSDESSADSSLVPFMIQSCQQGLMMGSNGVFMPKQLVTRGQVATVISRMLGEIDPQASQQEHFAYLQSQGIMNVANLDSAITRGDALLVLYRVANGDNTDLCTIDPTLPGCTDNGNGGNTGTVVKDGDLQISLNPSSPANMSSIPNNGVSRFGTVDFTAGAKDITINTVSLKRGGLGSYSDFAGGGRIYFEVAGYRVSSRSTVSSDDTATLSFAPALVVAAGKTVSVDLMAELVTAPVGTENHFMSTSIDSSAATVNGSITTPTLRTASYSVRTVSFTSQNVLTTYQGNEETVELGKFQLQNIGTNTINAKVKAITLRNVGNGTAATSLTDLKLLRAGNAVSTSVVMAGRDITFLLSDTITDGQTASYTVQGKVANVENAAGDTYKFILRQSTDLNATEDSTGFRTAVSITANAANDTTAASQYTVNGGELKFTRDTTLSLSQNVSPGTLHIEFMKGSITAKQAILLEDPVLTVSAGSATINNAFKKVYMQIGNTVLTWTPNATGANPTATFDGSVTVNGTVPVIVYADVYTNASVGGPYTFSALAGNAFTRKEYVSNQNSVASSIGSISASATSVVASALSVSKYDSLGTKVYTTNKATDKAFYGIRLSNSQTNDIKVGAITLNPQGFTGGASITLMQGSTALATKTLNNATTFNGLNILVKKDAPVDLMFVASFDSTLAPSINNTFKVSFNGGDVIDNVTSNAVNPNNVAPLTQMATSALIDIITAGQVQVSNTSGMPAKSFVAAGASNVKIGKITLRAINDELELRDLYLKVNGIAGFAANAGIVVDNLKLVDGATEIAQTDVDTVTNTNDIKKFKNITSGVKIPVGGRSFDVYANISSVNDAASVGEFNITLATTYDDTQYTNEYLGGRYYSVNAGDYVSAGSVTANAVLSNNMYVVGAYLVFSNATSANPHMIKVTVTNPSTNPVRLDSFKYVAKATVAGDINGLTGKVAINGTDELTGTVLADGATTTYTFGSPIEIQGGSSVELRVSLPSSYAGTNGAGADALTFDITDAGFTQVIGLTTASIVSVDALGYRDPVGLPKTSTITTP